MILKVENLGLSYSEFSLQKINFSMKRGERLAILGLSGSGKSSLLRSIYGLHNLDEGKTIFDEIEVEGPAKVLIPGDKRMKLVDQNFELDNYHTVEENISNKILHLEKAAITSKTEELLDVVNLKPYRNQVASSLSGGQKQRLAIARSLAEVPQLLLLDEPFSQIDQMNKFDIESRLFGYLDAHEITTIMVTHNYQDAFTLSSRVLIMKQGGILRDLDKKDLFLFPQSHYEALITGGYNEINLNGKRINFRRNEFSLSLTDEFKLALKVEVKDILYLGAKYILKVETKSKESFILESSAELEGINEIYLKDKEYNFADKKTLI